MLNVLSLCDGISCGQIALEKAGIKIDKYFASEIDNKAIIITRRNYPNTIQIGDIKDIEYIDGVLSWKGGKEKVKIHLVIAGTPCQDFSSFKINSKGLNGKRSSLFYNFSKILWEIEPTYFLFENVKMKKEWKDIISKELGVEPIEINSSDFSAQNRTRLYWTNLIIKDRQKKNIGFKDILEDLPFREIPKCFFQKWGNKQRINKGLNWTENTKGNCLTTKNCHTNQYLLNKDKTKIRLLTVEEYEKLQTIPEGYTKGISDTERFKCIGNGWTIDVISHILSHIPLAEQQKGGNGIPPTIEIVGILPKII